jgi:hypothetical protein
MKRALREYRGGILTDSFHIEMQLDRALAEFLFPSSENPALKPEDTVPITFATAKSLRGLFDEFVLKSGTMPTIAFSYKIDLLEKFAERLSTLRAAMPTGLTKTLHDVRRVRNNFAHYPIEFLPRGSIGNQTLDPVLTTHKAQIQLNQDFFETTGALFRAAIDGLTAVNEFLRNNFNRED